MRAIIIYFSRRGENYVGGRIKNLAVGNTEIAAELLAELTGAALFKLEMAEEYSADYSECINEAKRDQLKGIRPALKSLPADLAQYDVVYLGYPNYWGSMPMAVVTLLESCDFTGKTILPFCTHEGSGMGSSEADIRRICPQATLKAGLAINGGSAAKAKMLLQKWLRDNID